MSTRPARIALNVLLVLLAACGTWERVENSATRFSGPGYTLELPLGWMRIEQGGELLLSRDGPGIQQIVVRRAPHADAFPKLKKPSSAAILPLELAELYVAELRASDQHGLQTLQVLENRPIQIAGRPGFYLRLRYKNDVGLSYDQIAEGFVDASGYFTLRYTATTLHYFERNRTEFEALVASFQRTGS